MKQQLDAAINCGSNVSQAKSFKPARVIKKGSLTPGPTSEEFNSFFKDINLSGVKPAVLSIIPPYCDGYIPKPLDPAYPKLLTDFYDDSFATKNFMNVLEHCRALKVIITPDQAKNVEEATRSQTADKLWFKFRAGSFTF